MDGQTDIGQTDAYRKGDWPKVIAICRAQYPNDIVYNALENIYARLGLIEKQLGDHQSVVDRNRIIG